jgi:DNA-directed RNA polymerase subunit beta'
MTLTEVYEELKTKNIDTKIPFEHKYKTKNKSIFMSLGRIWFNLLTPEDYPLIDEQVNKSKISKIINDVYNKYPPEIASEFVTRLNKESFVLGTIIPSTFDIDSLIIPQEIVDKKKALLIDNPNLSPEEFNVISEKLAVEYLDYIKKEYNSGLYNIVMSGAKGSPKDWALLMIAKGAQMDIEGNISKSSTHSLDDGLNVEEFYSSAAEARYVQYYKSKGAAEPGYLSTQTAFANSNIMLRGEDCGTTKYFKLLVIPSLLSMIGGRYYLDEKTNTLKVIENDDKAKKLINTTIKLRSPLYCIQSDGICRTCYGKLAEVLATDKIGLLTAATINEQGVTKAMKVRHESSQISLRKANFIKDIITS